MLSKYKIQQRMSLQTQPTVAGRRTPTPRPPPPPPSSAPPRSPGDIGRFTKCCLDTGDEHTGTDTERGPKEVEEKGKTIK